MKRQRNKQANKTPPPPAATSSKTQSTSQHQVDLNVRSKPSEMIPLNLRRGNIDFNIQDDSHTSNNLKLNLKIDNDGTSTHQGEGSRKISKRNLKSAHAQSSHQRNNSQDDAVRVDSKLTFKKSHATKRNGYQNDSNQSRHENDSFVVNDNSFESQMDDYMIDTFVSDEYGNTQEDDVESKAARRIFSGKSRNSEQFKMIRNKLAVKEDCCNSSKSPSSSESEFVRARSPQQMSSSSESDASILSMGDNEENPEQQIHKFCEDYYNQAYFKYDMQIINDYVHNKVWNLKYDLTFDQVYAFIGSIKILNGQKQKLPNNINIDTMKGCQQHKYEMQAVQMWEKCEVQMTISLEIWNIDDRIIKDKDHRKRPQAEKLVLKRKEKFQKPQSLLTIMKILQNKFQDYTQLIQFDRKIMFYQGKRYLNMFSVEDRELSRIPIKVFDDKVLPKAFQTAIHYKDQCKISQSIESFMIFSFNQQEKSSKQQKVAAQKHHHHGHGHEHGHHRTTNMTQSSIQQEEELNMEDYTQSIELRIINFQDVIDSKNFSNLKKEDKDSTQTIYIKDEGLLRLYGAEQGIKNVKSFLIQRIDDSPTYIWLFATGLLLMVGTNPFSIQSKVTLNLKKDEHIIDMCYKVSGDGKNHCIWIMDSKFQIWKCFNERNPNLSNWTMIRIDTRYNVNFKKFMEPATTYEDYFMTSDLNGIDVFKKSIDTNNKHFQYLISYNGTATKAVLVQQPDLIDYKYQLGCDEKDKINSVQDYIERRLKLDKSVLANTKIKIMVVAKYQNIILNQIMQKKPRNMQEPRVQELQSYPSQSDFQEENQFTNVSKRKKDKRDAEDDDEIQELQYMGRIKLFHDQSPVIPNESYKEKSRIFAFRQFLVRRRRSLEIMITNGLSYSSVLVPQSTCYRPFEINDIILSRDNSKLIVYQSMGENESMLTIKIFRYVEESRNFELIQQDEHGTMIKKPKNFMLDEKGELFDVTIEIMGSKRDKKVSKKNIGFMRISNSIKIQVPRSVLFKELINQKNWFDRVILSGDRRIIMCGRALIQLNQDLTEVLEIGCVVHIKTVSKSEFKFHSLFSESDRKQIATLVKKQQTLESIVVYNSYPVYSIDYPEILYLSSSIKSSESGVHAQNEETAILRLETDTLNVHEIYKSRFKIINMSVIETKGDVNTTLTQGGTTPGSPFKQPKKRSKKKLVLDTPNLSQMYSGQNSNKRATEPDFDQAVAYYDTKKTGEKRKLNRINSGGTHHEGGSITIGMEDFMPANENDKTQSIIQNDKSKLLDNKEDGDADFVEIENESLESKPVSKSSKPKQVDQMPEGIRLSLVSQHKNEVNIEIILDIQQVRKQKKKDCKENQSLLKRTVTRLKSQENMDDDCDDAHPYDRKIKRSKLLYCLSFLNKNVLKSSSEAGWINREKLILTLNNHYFLVNLAHKDLVSVKNGIKYGQQQVNQDLYAILTCQKSQTEELSSSLRVLKDLDAKIVEFDIHTFKNSDEKEMQINDQLIKAKECIYRMEIASFKRYAFIQHAKNSVKQFQNYKFILFFQPCEELGGGSLFTKLSFDFKVIQPYIEQIDSELIELLNQKINSISYYISCPTNSRDQNLNSDWVRVMRDHDFILHGGDKSQLKQNWVHMYQDDISGENAIDHAFRKNSIFCIKLFVESLLQISNNEIQFRNCFDKALLVMINKDMDVKELINSPLFYPEIWTKYTLFSDQQKPTIRPYNNDLADLEYEDPREIFKEENEKEKENVEQQKQALIDDEDKEMELIKKALAKGIQKNMSKSSSKKEEIYEQLNENDEKCQMQYNYLLLDRIQGADKISLSKTLMRSENLVLFEQEAIQMIIDYKWNTYCRTFFLQKFLIFVIYIISFYFTLESTHITNQDGSRRKGLKFIILKLVSGSVQIFFLVYEFIQFKKEGQEYLYDFWNIFELLGIFFYFWGTVLDLANDYFSDLNKIVFTITVLLSLIKLMYLLRVFRYLSFLVMMLIQVGNDVKMFMLIFLIFSLTFAECFHIVDVDVTSYGRMPELLSLVIAVLRAAMGDFSIIDPYVGFDAIDIHIDPDTGLEVERHRHSRIIVIFTFVIFMASSYLLFMIFVNFIIALIAETYGKVSKYYVAHDYHQRVILIYEREVLMRPETFEDSIYFPNILVIRQKKHIETQKNNWQQQIKNLRSYMKEQITLSNNLMVAKQKEQKEHLTNSMKLLENEIQGVNKDIQKMISETQKIKVKLFGTGDNSPCDHSEEDEGSEKTANSPLLPTQKNQQTKNQKASLINNQPQQQQLNIQEQIKQQIPQQIQSRFKTANENLASQKLAMLFTDLKQENAQIKAQLNHILRGQAQQQEMSMSYSISRNSRSLSKPRSRNALKQNTQLVEMKPSLLPAKRQNGRTNYPQQPIALGLHNYRNRPLRNNQSEQRINNQHESIHRNIDLAQSNITMSVSRLNNNITQTNNDYSKMSDVNSYQ